MEPQVSFFKEYLQYFVGGLTTVVLAGFTYVAGLGNRVSILEEAKMGQKDKDDDLKEFMSALLNAKFDGINERLKNIEANGRHAHS